MHGPVFGEFLGTMVLVLFGDGVSPTSCSKNRRAKTADGWSSRPDGAWLCWPALSPVLAWAAWVISTPRSPSHWLWPAVPGQTWRPTSRRNWRARLLAPCWFGWSICHTGGRLQIKAASWPSSAPARPFAIFPPNALTEFLVTAIALLMVGFSIGSKGVAANGLAAGFGPYPVGNAGVGHRPIPGRTHRLCHQPGSRSGPAPRAPVASHLRQGKLRLGLCLGSDPCPGSGRLCGWIALQGLRHSVALVSCT